MPVSRDLAEELARVVVRLYQDAQMRIIERIARALERGIEQPDWTTEKLAGLGRLESELRVILARLDNAGRELIAEQLLAAYVSGGEAAAAEIAHLARVPLDEIARNTAAVAQRAAIQRLVGALTGALRGTHLPVLRTALDAYREAVAAGGAGDVLTGVSTRRQATQRAWSRLVDRGITGFTDVRGRQWNLASYTEMSMRTGVAQAAVEGHLDRLAGVGLDLVIVSNSAQECKLCRPYEGKILSRSGATGTVLAENPATGELVHVEISGTLADAIRGGLFHPNCRHSVSAYLPGLTTAPTHTADPEGDAARQRLRALERRVRRLKTQRAAAIDDAARKRYADLIAKAQADIRAHVASDSNLFRKPERERVNLGLK